MQDPISLKSAERKVFQATFADGLWDVLIGCVVLQLAIAPFLSQFLGDLWSSAVFLPFWGLVYFAIWWVRKKVIAPRIGTVTFGKPRQRKLRKFTIILVSVNVLALVLGLVAFLTFDQAVGAIYATILGLILLMGFSAAAYFLDYPRLYFYGLLLFVAPLVGEWLYVNYRVPHHGYPVVFGFGSGLMILTGLLSLVRLLKNAPRAEIPGNGR